jgi:large conductance mechanosensitive channel
MWSEFKAFISKGNVIDLAVAFILGTAFAAVVKGLVDWIIMPPVGLVLGGVDFSGLYVNLSNKTFASAAEAMAAKAPGIYYGEWINTVITFLIVALVMFFVVRAYNSTQPKAAVDTKKCPYCVSEIPSGATRCPACTSQLDAATIC